MVFEINPYKPDVLLERNHHPRRPNSLPPSDLKLYGHDLLNQFLLKAASTCSFLPSQPSLILLRLLSESRHTNKYLASASRRSRGFFFYRRFLLSLPRPDASKAAVFSSPALCRPRRHSPRQLRDRVLLAGVVRSATLAEIVLPLPLFPFVPLFGWRATPFAGVVGSQKDGRLSCGHNPNSNSAVLPLTLSSWFVASFSSSQVRSPIFPSGLLLIHFLVLDLDDFFFQLAISSLIRILVLLMVMCYRWP